MMQIVRIIPKLNVGKLIPKHQRLVNIHTSSTCSSQDNNNCAFKTAYKFPYIRVFAVINRIKLYHTCLTLAATPIVLVLNQMGYIAFDSFMFTCGLGVSCFLPLYSIGYFTNKFIGFIYYNEEKSIVKVAYIDFWGKRKDIEVPLNDIVPLSEQNMSYTDGLYLKFRRYSNKDILKYNVKYGISEKKLIDKILS